MLEFLQGQERFLCPIIHAGKSRNSVNSLETALQEHPGRALGMGIHRGIDFQSILSETLQLPQTTSQELTPTLPQTNLDTSKASLCPGHVPLWECPSLLSLLGARIASRMINLEGNASTWQSEAVPTSSLYLFHEEFQHFGFLLQSEPEETLGRKKKKKKLNQILSLDVKWITLKEQQQKKIQKRILKKS